MSVSNLGILSRFFGMQRKGGSYDPPAPWLLVTVIAFFALLSTPVSADTAVSAEVSKQETRHPRANSYMKRRWGIEIVFVRRTSGGYMLEFRYKVIDPVKARPLFDRQSKPMLTHEETGSQFVVPTPAKTGALRNSNPPIEDRVYWMFFANPAKYVQKGDFVTIKIGEFAATNIVVE